MADAAVQVHEMDAVPPVCREYEQWLAERGVHLRVDGYWNFVASADTARTYQRDRVHRDAAVRRFSWAVPTMAALQGIAALPQPVLEVGAGTGYWAACLRALGADVVATDSFAWRSHRLQRWGAPVVRIGAVKAVLKYRQARTLLLVWPPKDLPMAADALEAFAGDHVVYVGEHSGGCTADDAFHDQLEASWVETGRVGIPQWHYVKDAAYFYRRAT